MTELVEEVLEGGFGDPLGHAAVDVLGRARLGFELGADGQLGPVLAQRAELDGGVQAGGAGRRRREAPSAGEARSWWAGGPAGRAPGRPGVLPGPRGRRPANRPTRPPGRRPDPDPGGQALAAFLGGGGQGGQPAGRGVDQRLLDQVGGQGQLQVVAHEHASHTGPLPGPPVGSNGPRLPGRSPDPKETRTVASTSTPGGDRPVAAARPPGGRGGTCWWPGSCWPTWRRAGWSWPWGSGSPAGLAGPAPGAAGRGHQRHRRLERALRGRAAADATGLRAGGDGTGARPEPGDRGRARRGPDGPVRPGRGRGRAGRGGRAGARPLPGEPDRAGPAGPAVDDGLVLRGRRGRPAGRDGARALAGRRGGRLRRRLPGAAAGPRPPQRARLGRLAVVGTQFTLWPTVLRTRMVPGLERAVRWSLPPLAGPGRGRDRAGHPAQTGGAGRPGRLCGRAGGRAGPVRPHGRAAAADHGGGLDARGRHGLAGGDGRGRPGRPGGQPAWPAWRAGWPGWSRRWSGSRSRP